MRDLYCMNYRLDGKYCGAVFGGLDFGQLRGPVEKPDKDPYVCLEWTCPVCGTLMVCRIVHRETGEIYDGWLVKATYGVAGIDRSASGVPIHNINRLKSDRQEAIGRLRDALRERLKDEGGDAECRVLIPKASDCWPG